MFSANQLEFVDSWASENLCYSDGLGVNKIVIYVKNS